MEERRPQQNRPHREGGGSPRQDEHGPGHQGPSQAIAKFKQAIASKGFTDDEVMRQSEELAKSFIKSGNKEGEKENSLTQVRKFYNQVKVVQQKANAAVDFNIIKPEVRLLQAQAAYAVGRKLLTGDFKDFFDEAAKKIIKEGQESLNDFAKFFQSVYAYFYFYTKTGEAKSEGRAQ